MDCRANCPIKETGGFCERHGIRKTAAWAKLCIQRDNYFRAWEEGRGPGQQLRSAEPASGLPVPTRGAFPSFAQMAWNLAQAVADFGADVVKNGLRGALVSPEEYQRRLEICDQCVPPEGYRTGDRCSHQACGCYLSIKAKGRAFRCPIGKWESPPEQPSTSPTT